MRCKFILLKPTKKRWEENKDYCLFEVTPCDENQKPVSEPIEVDGTRITLWDFATIHSEIKIDLTKEGVIRVFSDQLDFLYSEFDNTFQLVKP